MFTHVKTHGNFQHHIIYSFEEKEAAESIELFTKLSQESDVLGFDLEWISAKDYPDEEHAAHVEEKSSNILCTIQFGCGNTALTLCLSKIYKNDSGNSSLKFPDQIVALLNRKLTCFGGFNDLRVLKKNYPSVFDKLDKMKMNDPTIRLKELGADRPNLISMAKVLLDFKSDKKKWWGKDWTAASIRRYISAGEDAILSLKIYEFIELSPEHVLTSMLREHSYKEKWIIREKRILECKDPITQKIMLRLSDEEDGIAENRYTMAMASFLGTMKFPPMKWSFDRTNKGLWECTLSISLDDVSLGVEVIHASSISKRKKDGQNLAVRSIFKKHNYLTFPLSF